MKSLISTLLSASLILASLPPNLFAADPVRLEDAGNGGVHTIVNHTQLFTLLSKPGIFQGQVRNFSAPQLMQIALQAPPLLLDLEISPTVGVEAANRVQLAYDAATQTLYFTNAAGDSRTIQLEPESRPDATTGSRQSETTAPQGEIAQRGQQFTAIAHEIATAQANHDDAAVEGLLHRIWKDHGTDGSVFLNAAGITRPGTVTSRASATARLFKSALSHYQPMNNYDDVSAIDRFLNKEKQIDAPPAGMDDETTLFSRVTTPVLLAWRWVKILWRWHTALRRTRARVQSQDAKLNAESPATSDVEAIANLLGDRTALELDLPFIQGWFQFNDALNGSLEPSQIQNTSFHELWDLTNSLRTAIQNKRPDILERLFGSWEEYQQGLRTGQGPSFAVWLTHYSSDINTIYSLKQESQDRRNIFGYDSVPSRVLGWSAWKALFDWLNSDPQIRKKYRRQIGTTFKDIPSDLWPWDDYQYEQTPPR